MGEVPILGQTVANTLENGKRTKNTEEDIKCGQMVPHSKENGKMPSSMDEEDTRGQVEVLMKECG